MPRVRTGLGALRQRGAASRAPRPIANPSPVVGAASDSPPRKESRGVKDLTTWIGRRRIVLLAGALALLVVGAGLATPASSGSTKGSETAAQQSNNGNGKGHVTVGHSVKNDKS